MLKYKYRDLARIQLLSKKMSASASAVSPAQQSVLRKLQAEYSYSFKWNPKKKRIWKNWSVCKNSSDVICELCDLHFHSSLDGMDEVTSRKNVPEYSIYWSISEEFYIDFGVRNGSESVH